MFERPLQTAQQIAFSQGLPPLSLYIHVPWCLRKCPYCDFNSHAAPAELPESAYLQAVEQDLLSVLPQVWGRPIHTVFIGGGTPSLLSAKTIDALLSLLRRLFNLAPGTEITLEANPGATEAQRFRDYAQAGVTRLSIGVQSFDDAQLQLLGRVHSADQARRAIDQAQRAVDRVNIDLMYALPGQNVAQALQDVRTALQFGTEHLSLYNLTMEPNTLFAKYPPAHLPDDDLAGDIQDALIAEAAQAGLGQYEVSAYAKVGAMAQHNYNYWSFGDYIGVGPGAHGKISQHDRIVRTARIKNPDSWMQKVHVGQQIAETRVLSVAELPFEFMLNALRLKEGVPSALFEAHCGVSIATLLPMLNLAVEKGLLADDPMRLVATPLGWRYLNDLQSLFLADA